MKSEDKSKFDKKIDTTKKDLGQTSQKTREDKFEKDRLEREKQKGTDKF